jgi:RND family efflux transporter MFP subunit
MSNESRPPAERQPQSSAPANSTPAAPLPAARRPVGAALSATLRLAKRLDKRVAGVALALVAVIVVWRAVAVHAKSSAPTLAPAAAALVPVARVAREDLFNEVHYYGEFRPYLEVELHAKVAGYVQSINVDFGDHVKAGQLIATLEVPELKDELDASKAAQQKAEADYKDAHLNYTRLLAVDKDHPGLVAQQDLDNAESRDLMTKAAIAAARAEVEKYETLFSYTKITAPFDGVITHRSADPGTLIQAGTASDTQSMPVVRVSDNYHLRLDFPVSVSYVKDIHPGVAVQVQVESLGDRTITGIITRSTQRVNEDTRKMLAEIEVPNPNLELVPGMYATVVLKSDQRNHALAIPIEAVPPGQSSTVYVVNDKSEIEEHLVTLGMDTPTKYEVLAGLKEGDLVLLGSRSNVRLGQKVAPKFRESLAQD